MLFPTMLAKSTTRRAVALAYTTPHATLSPNPQRLLGRSISTGISASGAGTTANSAGASAATPGTMASFWSRLSPTTRRNVKIAFAVGAVTDAYVAYHYLPNLLGGNVARKE